MRISQRLQLFFRDPIAFFSHPESREELGAGTQTIQATARFALNARAGKVFSVIRQAVSGFGILVQGFLSLFTIKDLVDNIQKARTAEKPKTKIKAILRSIVSGAEVTSFVVGALAKIPFFYQILYPVTFLDAGLTIYKTHRSVKFYEEMQGKVKLISDKVNEVEKRANIEEACRFVIEKDKKIEKKLAIEEDARIQEKAKSILQSGDVKRGESFMKLLRDRVNTKMGLDIAATATKIAGIIAFGLLLFMPPNPITFAIAVAVALTALGILITNRVTSEVISNRLSAV